MSADTSTGGRPPAVRRALVHATSVLTTRDENKQLLSVDMRPLVIHLIAGLEQAGFERAVVTLGHDASSVADCVSAYGFARIKVDFVFLTLGSAANAVWRNLASSVIAARTAFTGPDPLLIVRADQLYDWRLLRKMAEVPFDEPQFEAYALIDVSPEILSWADGQYCSEGCQRGHCHALAKVSLDSRDRRRVARCGHRLRSYDAVVAGEVYATRPRLFELLARQSSLSISLGDAVAELASQGTLGAVEVHTLLFHASIAHAVLPACFHRPYALPSSIPDSSGGIGRRPPASCSPGVLCLATAVLRSQYPFFTQVGDLSAHWFSSRTVARVFRPARPSGASGGSRRPAPWSHLVTKARELLYSGEWRPTANMPTPPVRCLTNSLPPLFDLPRIHILRSP